MAADQGSLVAENEIIDQDLRIGFSFDAGDWFRIALDALNGVIAQVTDYEEQTFYAMILGADREAEEWDAVRIQVQDKNGEMVGPVFSHRLSRITIS